MVGRAGAALVVIVLAAACDGGGSDDDADKRVRQGAVASVAGELVWVAGGTEGPADELFVGDTSRWTPSADVVAYDLDGAEVASVTLVLEEQQMLVEPAVADVGGRILLAGGSCPSTGFGCNGPTTPVLAWLDADSGRAEPVPVEVVGEGPAMLLGVGGGAAWVLVDPRAEARLLRLDGDTGEAVLSELPSFVWTGDVCAGPDGLVAAVADLDDRFVAVNIELFARGTSAGDTAWTSTGILPMGEREPGAVRLHCIGDGHVVLDLRDEDGPLVVAVDGATVVVEAPEGLRGGEQVVLASDPSSGAAVATEWGGGSGVEPVLAYRLGGRWVEVGRMRPSATLAPVLAVAGRTVLDVAGMAVVAGARPQRVATL